MPLYEFRCKDCNNQFEALLTSSSQFALNEVKCPKCGGGNVVKTISAASYRLATTSSTPIGKPLGGCASKGGFS